MIKLKAYTEEPEELVKGIHEPIISEDLFLEVESVLSGRKKLKLTHSSINEEYPLRGHLQCPRCGKLLTASSSLGNGGKYVYYHCTRGCKERHKNDVVHEAFEDWVSSVSIKPEVASLYLAVMEDIFKTKKGSREAEIKNLETEVSIKMNLWIKL